MPLQSVNEVLQMVATRDLGRSRHIRLTEEHNEQLQILASQEGCSVSDLIRRAIIRTFFLPSAATNGSGGGTSGSEGQTQERTPEQDVTGGLDD